MQKIQKATPFASDADALCPCPRSPGFLLNYGALPLTTSRTTLALAVQAPRYVPEWGFLSSLS